MMKKRWFSILVLSLMAVGCCALGACKGGEQGAQGEPGKDGKSAYQIWLDNGNTGTEADFLNWLKSDANAQTQERLRFQKISGKDEYRVMGMGTVSLLDVVIPETYRGLPVTEIKSYAFRNCSSLTSVEIGNGVTSIGSYAFQSCDSLTSIEIPDSVTSIGDYAFSDCSSLTSVVIGDSVTSIGDYAFWFCDSLTSVVIGDSVTSIGVRAFSNCSSLTSVVIGDSVTSIGYGAFSGCRNLTSVVIPDGVTSIGEEAFRYCSSLTSITFEGTMEEWKAITKDSKWDYNVPATEVICSDGRVSLI